MLPAASDFIECVQGAAFSGYDIVSRFGPDERFRFCVVQQQVVVDGALQIADAGIAAAPDALRGDLGKEPFDQVQP